LSFAFSYLTKVTVEDGLNPHFSQPVVGFGVSEAKSRVASRGSTGPANRLFFAEVRKAEEIRRFPLVLEKRVRNAG